MSPRCGPALTLVDAYPKVRAVHDERRRSVALYKEVGPGLFLEGGNVQNPQVVEVADACEAPIWLRFPEREAVAIREALNALGEAKSDPVTADERERYLRIIERLSGTREAA